MTGQLTKESIRGFLCRSYRHAKRAGNWAVVSVALLGWGSMVGCEPTGQNSATNGPNPQAISADRDGPADSDLFNQSDSRKTELSPRAKAVRFLMQRQSDDGLWRSRHYGNLKGGAATSCLVLLALAQVGDELSEPQRAACQRCVESLLELVDERGFVAAHTGPDYSNYATAIFLLATDQLRIDVPPESRQKMVVYLLRSQLDENEGLDASDVDFGGWDLTGWMEGHRPTTGTNVSVTAFVLEALRNEMERGERNGESRLPQALLSQIENECAPKAAVWLTRCHASGKGFCFHPKQSHDGNKAQWTSENRETARPYGTATADGIRCGLALSRLTSEAETIEQLQGQIEAAKAWLFDFERVVPVPGFEDESSRIEAGKYEIASWGYGLRYYYWMSLTRAGRRGGWNDEQFQTAQEAITLQLLSQQKPAGEWSNQNARMREDDPLIATSFALMVFSR